MFTGIVEYLGTVKSCRASTGGRSISVDIGHLASDVAAGASIAVNGTCLTITAFHGNIADFDISPETLERTTLGKIAAAERVNLERAMRADGRFDGHFMTGHIDGTAKIKNIDQKGKFWNITYQADNALLENMIFKGSVAIDGISLTIAALCESGFVVAIIPATWQRTNIQFKRIGDLVNIETDIIAKMINRQISKIQPDKLTENKLREHGFA